MTPADPRPPIPKSPTRRLPERGSPGAAPRPRDAMLSALRHEGDPEADAVVAEFIRVHGVTNPRTLVRSLIQTTDPLTAALPTPRLAEYLAARESALPDWHEPELIRRGQAWFETNGLAVATALFCASLPTAYLSANGAKVISITGALVSDPRRRVGETAQLLTAVMDVGAANSARQPPASRLGIDPGCCPLSPGTPGFRAARGVRLMHAAVRTFIVGDAEAATHYDVATFGVPVNQEDLVGTLLTFTTVVFDALHAMGIVVDLEDAEAYLHTWCVVGHLLGIRADLLPLSYDEATALDRAIRERQAAPSRDGVDLMAALGGEMRSHMPFGFKRFPAALVRTFLGDAAADALAVGRPGPARLFVWVLPRSGRLWSRAPGRALRDFVARTLGRHMIRAYIATASRGERPAWDYSAFADSWKLAPLRQRVPRAARARIATRRASRT